MPHGREPPHEREFPFGREPLRGRGRLLPRGRGRGRDPIGLRRGRYLDDDLAFDEWDVMGRYPMDLPLEEELYFERLRERELMLEREMLRDLPPERKQIRQSPRIDDKSHAKPAGDNSEVDARTIMEKAKALSNIDVENLLSAVKSIKGSSTEDDATKSV